MEEKQPKFLSGADIEKEDRELDRIAELNKDNPKFVKSFRRTILQEITELTFRGFYSEHYADIIKDSVSGTKTAEGIPNSVFEFKINLEKETEDFKEIGQIEYYCKSNGISFPSPQRVQQLKRAVAKSIMIVFPSVLKTK